MIKFPSPKRLSLGSFAVIATSIILLAVPALSYNLISGFLILFQIKLNLLSVVGLLSNIWWLDLIPKAIGAALLVTVILRSRLQVDASKLKKQFLRFSVVGILALFVISTAIDLPVAKAEAVATTGYILDTPLPIADWYIGKYSNGNYFAINGSNWDNLVAGVGSTAWSSYTSNYTKLEELVLAQITYGTVYLKEVPHNSSLTIPASVTVVQNLNGALSYFGKGTITAVNIDSTQPQSAYSYMIYQDPNFATNGLYNAKASNGTICWTSTNASYIINTVISQGDNNHIVLGTGNFILPATNGINGNGKSGIIFEGQGKGTIISVTAGFTGINPFSLASGLNRWEIKNFVLDCTNQADDGYNGLVCSADNSTVKGVEFIGASHGNIVVSGTGNLVTECYSHDARDDGIILQDTNNTRVINSYFVNMRDRNGISIVGGNHNLIDNNIVDTVTSQFGFGIENLDGHMVTDTVISNNIVRNVATGFQFYARINGYGDCASNVTVQGNTVDASGSGNCIAVNLLSGSYVTVQNNLLKSSSSGGSSYGVYGSNLNVTNLAVKNNEVLLSPRIGGYSVGVYCSAVSNPVILGNTIIGAFLGIDTESLANAVVSQNTVTALFNNATSIGIYGGSCSNHTISENYVNGAWKGIAVSSCAIVSIRNNHIFVNSVAATTYGLIFGSSSTEVTVTDNDINGAIRGIDAGGNNLLITGNKIRTAADGNARGILIQNSLYNQINNNVLTGAGTSYGNGIYFLSTNSSQICFNTITNFNTCIKDDAACLSDVADYNTMSSYSTLYSFAGASMTWGTNNRPAS